MISDPVIQSRMHYKIPISVVILLFAAIVLAGCTGTQSSSGTGTSTTGSYAGSPSVADSLVPSPTDVVPAPDAVTVDVGEKDYLGSIPVIFQGGMGQIHVVKIEATLYRSDGQVNTVTIDNNKGAEADLAGTKQNDRVVVYITFDNGERLKTNDVISVYRTRG
jgi:hypothetical protein